MSQRQFSALLLLLSLLVVCCTCGPAHGGNTLQPKSVDLLVAGETEAIDMTGCKKHEVDLRQLRAPSLFSVNGVMFVFAEADITESGIESVSIVSRYIGTEGRDWVKNVFAGNGSNWKTQMILQGKKEEGYVSELNRLMTVVKDKKMYLFALHHKTKAEDLRRYVEPVWNFTLAVGEVKLNSGVKGIGKIIQWKIPESPLLKFNEKFRNLSLRVSSYPGVLLLQDDRNIAFAVRAVESKKNVGVIIYSKGTGEQTKWEFLYVEAGKGCSFPHFFGWKEKIITITYCLDGKQSVKESTDMGKTWTDVIGAFARVCNKLKGIRDFGTVTIENKTVLLFTEQKIVKTSTGKNIVLFLWFTDGDRSNRIGAIAVGSNYLASRGFSYTNGELFFLHQEYSRAVEKGIILTRLTYELENIKSVLKIWATNDEYLSRPCNKTTPQGASLDIPCMTPMPTYGLVGFLSDNGNNTYWQDEYLYVNANVKGGTKVRNGFTFNGTGSGAQWPMGKQGADQQYNFADYGLTVVATVTIHEVPERNIPLLTFGGVPNNEHVGLWYGKDKMWKIISKNVVTASGVWETNKTYRVAVTLQNNSLSVHVDGIFLGDPLPLSTSGAPLLEPNDLFIGAYEEDIVNPIVSHATITNVYLYNWLFDADELKTLSNKTFILPKSTKTGDSSLHVPVGSLLLLLLGLWGLYCYLLSNDN